MSYSIIMIKLISLIHKAVSNIKSNILKLFTVVSNCEMKDDYNILFEKPHE
jgi:hypothetical protein